MAIYTPPEFTVVKQELTYDELRDVVDLSLWVGQLLLQHGAPTQSVEAQVHLLATSLGCDWIDILISPNGLLVSTSLQGDFRTRLRRVVSMGVNLNIVYEVMELVEAVTKGQHTRAQVRAELGRISQAHHNYTRWQVALMVGLACAAFCRLFGGDAPVMAVTFVASGTAMLVRQQLLLWRFNPYLVTISTAFVAGTLAGVASLLQWGAQPSLALASAVLLLVPGVPLLNSAADLLRGHVVMGTTRGIIGGLIVLCIALGLLVAIRLLGVTGL
jgi:uncharacterized membrane protein YjjP (DUF1212 family)